MAIQFTVQAKVTIVNELHLTGVGINRLMSNPTYQPVKDDIMDRNLVKNSDILILRMSTLFKKAWPYKTFVNNSYVIKNRW